MSVGQGSNQRAWHVRRLHHYIVISLDEDFLKSEKEKQLQEIESRWKNADSETVE